MTARTEPPETITRYLNAHRARHTDIAIGTFADDATVIDDGNTYTGSAAIREWLAHAANEYTYTVELTGAERVDDATFVVTNHLEGDFPGGVVDLRYRFTLRDGLIERLTIEP
ncbi:nuclear transport factor 2 family protein [Actinomadura sp. HBU206391]|uniref:nuclear transport factor 2 family protein n=1 Tax=Actinomadura sp. HBU206391 TaxID=2731692 RepID=UPI00164F5250|nr:nuclear transport factor 2 family protein [Actinomadura sp. HBU206391]MBC6460578.1 nuclear transport factor 2 family protein [Actinomadura sp. HBU206391]